MNKKQNILLIFIIFLIIITTVIAIMLCTINNITEQNISNVKNDDAQHYVQNTVSDKMELNKYELDPDIKKDLLDEGEEIIYTYNNKLEHVTDRNKYFTIKAIFDNYINMLGYGNEKYVLDILSPQYKKEYNINENNIKNTLKIPQPNNPKQYYVTNIQEMLNTEIDFSLYVYIIKAKCRLVGENTIFDISAMIEVDETNNVYNLYPETYIKDKGLDNLRQGDTLNYIKEEISNREKNNFKYVTKTDVEMANEYFDHYQELINYYPDQAFEKLNPEYMQKRFGNKENFLKHLEENKNTLSYMQIDKYKVYSRDDYADYVCTDKYENLYTFRQQGGTMRYSVFLDNYTVPAQYYIEEYNEKSERAKIPHNLSKVMNMINTKDYNALYNVLDPTFRENNFKTVEDLKQYIKSNIYNQNAIEINDYEDSKYEYYVCKCDIINMDNRNQKRSATIVVEQGKGLDFKMSFSFENN